MKGKLVFLFLALVLPSLIFLFLKFFGKNEFEVTPLFNEGVSETPEECFVVSDKPYHIPDSVLMQLGRQDDDSLTLIYFAGAKPDQEVDVQLKRVMTQFHRDPIRMVKVLVHKDTVRTNLGSNRFLNKIADEGLANRWKQCVFFLKPPYDIVLIDGERRIRGHYTASDWEDVDRLITEVTIILKKY